MDDSQKLMQDELRRTQYAVSGVPYHVHTGTDAPQISYLNLRNAPRGFIQTATTSGTTAVPVFTTTGASFPFTITGVFIISRDNTASNISLLNNGTLVTLVSKGSSGVLTGSTSLSNTSYLAGNQITISSNNAGNAQVFMTYTLV